MCNLTITIQFTEQSNFISYFDLHYSPYTCIRYIFRDLCIVHSPTNAIILNLKKFKIHIKCHINIPPTCYGLRPSSGSVYRAWLPHLHILFKDVILMSVLT